MAYIDGKEILFSPEVDIVNESETTKRILYGTRYEKQIRNALNLEDTDILTGGFFESAQHWNANADFNQSGYIPVTGNRVYIYYANTKLFSRSTWVHFYDSDKKHIGQSMTSTVNGYEVPENAAYIRLPFKTINSNSQMVFFLDAVDGFSESQTSADGFDFVAYNEIIFTFHGGEIGLIENVENLQEDVENTQSDIAEIKTSHWSGKQWYAYGTSLTSTEQGKYVPFVAEWSGLNVTNKGLPGGGIANNTRVKDAVMNATDGKLSADLITLEVGANDISAELGTIYDTGNDTFCGALNQCIRYLQENTTAQIVVISSTTSRTNPPEYKYATDEHTWLDQKKATEDVCKLNGVHYIPMGENAGIGGTRLNDTYLVDNIHHTDIGGYNLAQFVWSRLKEIPPWFTEIPE